MNQRKRGDEDIVRTKVRGWLRCRNHCKRGRVVEIIVIGGRGVVEIIVREGMMCVEIIVRGGKRCCRNHCNRGEEVL